MARSFEDRFDMCIRMILTRLNCFSTRLIENGFYSIIFSNFRFFFLEFLLIYKKSQRLLCDRNKELITVIIGLMQSISIFSFTMCHNLRRRIYYYWHLRISPRQLPGIFNFQLSSPSLFYSRRQGDATSSQMPWGLGIWNQVSWVWVGRAVPVECIAIRWTVIRLMWHIIFLFGPFMKEWS